MNRRCSELEWCYRGGSLSHAEVSLNEDSRGGGVQIHVPYYTECTANCLKVNTACQVQRIILRNVPNLSKIVFS